MISVILADDHTIIRQGICALIERTDDIKLVAECGDGISAKKLIELHKPDVAVLDIAMPQMDGLTLAGHLIKEQHPTRIIILTTYDDPLLHQQALRLGVNYFLAKVHAFEILLETIRLAYLGKRGIKHIQDDSDKSCDAASFKLTRREREVLKLVSNGMTNRMIAEHLEISIKTVDRHRTNLMSKLGLHTSAQLSRFAIQTGLS